VSIFSFVSRRDVLRALGIASVGLVACSTPQNPPAQPTTAPAATKPAAGSSPVPGASPVASAAPATKPAANVKTGGTIRVARQGDYAGPLYPWQNQAALGLTVKLGYERLTRYNDALEAQNWLAEKIDISPDAKEWKVTLQKGITFHDGKPLTSADVAYTWKKVQEPKVNAAARDMALWFTSTEQPDANTIIFKSDKPRSAATDLFEYMDIVDEKTIEVANPDKVNGTGPFKLASKRDGVSWDFTKNTNYWRTGRPYVDGVRIDLFADAQSKTLAFESGSADILEGPGLRDIVRYEQEKKYNIVPLTGFLYLLSINTTKAPWNNKAARQALQHAVDRKRIVDTVLQGKGDPRNLPWPSNSEAYEASKANSTPFDLDKAKSMLTAAGVTNASIDIISNAPLIEVTAMTQIIQSDFSKLGLNVSLKPLETAAWTALGLSRDYVGINAALTSFVAIRPSTLPISSNFFRVGDNRAGWEHPEYARLAEAAGAEPDKAKRQQILFQLNSLLLDESPLIFIGTADNFIVGQKNMNGFGRDANYQLDVYDAWLG
jgi:peptide/nickel transport system substrate-binding protein